MKFKLKYSILFTESDGEYDGVEYDSFEAAERARLRALYKERKQYGEDFIIWIEEVWK